jgi:hypothetical protein
MIRWGRRSSRAHRVRKEHQETMAAKHPDVPIVRHVLEPAALANFKGKPRDYLRHFYRDTCVLSLRWRRPARPRDCSALRCQTEVA